MTISEVRIRLRSGAHVFDRLPEEKSIVTIAEAHRGAPGAPGRDREVFPSETFGPVIVEHEEPPLMVLLDPEEEDD